MSDTSATPWTVARHAPLSRGFSRQESWSGLPFPSPADLPEPGIKPGSPALQADSLPFELFYKKEETGKAVRRVQQDQSPHQGALCAMKEESPNGTSGKPEGSCGGCGLLSWRVGGGGRGAALIRLVREVSDLETFGEGVRVGKRVSASQSHTS